MAARRKKVKPVMAWANTTPRGRVDTTLISSCHLLMLSRKRSGSQLSGPLVRVEITVKHD